MIGIYLHKQGTAHIIIQFLQLVIRVINRILQNLVLYVVLSQSFFIFIFRCFRFFILRGYSRVSVRIRLNLLIPHKKCR